MARPAPRSRRRRPLAPAGILALALSLAACSTAPRTAAETTRDNLAQALFGALNARGLPLTSGAVGCRGPSPAALSCYATTDNTPPFDVSAQFRAKPGRYGARCPGKLSIDIDGKPFTTVAADPCA